MMGPLTDRCVRSGRAATDAGERDGHAVVSKASSHCRALPTADEHAAATSAGSSALAELEAYMQGVAGARPLQLLH